MRIVGLTADIGGSSGKSTVYDLFKLHGIPFVDADVVTQNVLKKGTAGWRKVVAAFGNGILLSSGEVNRLKLWQIVINDDDKRQLLIRLLAPYICSGIFLQVFKLWIKGSKTIVLDMSLLFEAEMGRLTKPFVVVWVDPVTQPRRVMTGHRTTSAEAKADIVIDTSGSEDDLNARFKEVLSHVQKPLTWIEFLLSRDGAAVAFASILVGAVVIRKAL